MRVSTIPCMSAAVMVIATAGGGARAATPFCDGLKSVIAAADNDFLSLQGAANRTEARVVSGRLILPRADDCVVVDGEDYFSYVCTFGYRTPAERQAQAASLSAEIAACVGVAAKPAASREGLFAFNLPYAIVVGSRRDSGPPANLYGVRLEVIPFGH